MKRCLIFIGVLCGLLLCCGCEEKVQVDSTVAGSKDIPTQEEFIENMEKAGYDISYEENFSGREGEVTRIIAKSNSSIIDICFGEAEALPTPAEYKELYSSLGFLNWYRICSEEKWDLSLSMSYYVSDEDTYVAAGLSGARRRNSVRLKKPDEK